MVTGASLISGSLHQQLGGPNHPGRVRTIQPGVGYTRGSAVTFHFWMLSVVLGVFFFCFFWSYTDMFCAITAFCLKKKIIFINEWSPSRVASQPASNLLAQPGLYIEDSLYFELYTGVIFSLEPAFKVMINIPIPQLLSVPPSGADDVTSPQHEAVNDNCFYEVQLFNITKT